MNLFVYYLIVDVISLCHLTYFYCLLKFTRGIENIKCCIKRHIESLEHGVSCKLFSNFLNQFIILPKIVLSG